MTKKKSVKPVMKSAATLTIRRAADMSPQGRKDIATWLRKQASDLLKYADNYSAEVRANYWFEEPRP
jgi:hypothetical protein